MVDQEMPNAVILLGCSGGTAQTCWHHEIAGRVLAGSANVLHLGQRSTIEMPHTAFVQSRDDLPMIVCLDGIQYPPRESLDKVFRDTPIDCRVNAVHRLLWTLLRQQLGDAPVTCAQHVSQQSA